MAMIGKVGPDDYKDIAGRLAEYIKESGMKFRIISQSMDRVNPYYNFWLYSTMENPERVHFVAVKNREEITDQEACRLNQPLVPYVPPEPTRTPDKKAMAWGGPFGKKQRWQS
jgi:hypothetical protein